jgi:hypothetical protein
MALASTTETNTDLPPVHLAANGHTVLFISHKLGQTYLHGPTVRCGPMRKTASAPRREKADRRFHLNLLACRHLQN